MHGDQVVLLLDVWKRYTENNASYMTCLAQYHSLETTSRCYQTEIALLRETVAVMEAQNKIIHTRLSGTLDHNRDSTKAMQEIGRCLATSVGKTDNKNTMEAFSELWKEEVELTGLRRENEQLRKENQQLLSNRERDYDRYRNH